MDLSWIGKYWLEVLFGLICSGFGLAIKHLYSKVKKFSDLDKAQREATLALLDDRMGQMMTNCKTKGFATRDEARRYTRMYDAYHGLGGNGAVTAEYEQFKKLDIRDNE